MKKNKLCTDFEEMLMWTSYRYCIGRHTYVVSMANDIAQNYYNRLSDERKQFSAEDIRKEIYNYLKFLPFDLEIDRWYNQDEFNPLKVLFNFFNKYDINSLKDLGHISKIKYNVNKDEYEFNTCEPNIKTYISESDIEDLIPWETLASVFDVKNHKLLTLTDGTKVEAFKTWSKKVIPFTEKPGYYINAEFGWEEIWKPVEEFINGNIYKYIPEENIVEISEIDIK